jgi:hypothetical protein
MIRDININEILTGWWNYIKGELGTLDSQTKALAEKRLRICETCPNRKTNQCGLCGCFLIGKTANPQSTCPDNPKRW